jgi:Xaa-Pro aminopeptidase
VTPPRSISFLCLLAVHAWAGSGPDAGELARRRRALMDKVPDGIVLLRASSAMTWEAASFRQDPAFYYFTGLANAHQALLAVDGAAKEAWLFAGPAPDSTPFVPHLRGPESIFVAPGAESQRALGLDHVVPWDRLPEIVASRRETGAKLKLYLDSGGFAGALSLGSSTPKGVAPVEPTWAVWRKTVHDLWPDAQVEDATPLLDSVRAVKSAEEVALLKKAAELTLPAFWSAVAKIRPGNRQRAVEATVAAACVHAGAEGPSFWPWIRSGPLAGPAFLFEPLADYHNLDRTMTAGEVVRVDLGCELRLYKADYGRTIPVSGRFDRAQRELLDLVVGAYRAGVAQMRPGRTQADVFRATAAHVIERRGRLETTLAREAAASVDERTAFFLHGIGIDLIEATPPVFQAGNVLCYEPRLTARDQSFFVEDMFLVTASGPERISPDLPYTADALEKEIAKRRRR